MTTARSLTALVALSMGCGPTTITVTTGDDAAPPSTGEESSGPVVTTTGEPLDTTTGSADDTSGATEGGSSGSSGEGQPPSVCAVDHSSNHCVCIFEDGTVLDGAKPAMCGCALDATGLCYCDGMEWPAVVCGAADPCFDPTTAQCSCPITWTEWTCKCGAVDVLCPCLEVGGGCYCSNVQVPLESCGCVLTDEACLCAGATAPFMECG